MAAGVSATHDDKNIFRRKTTVDHVVPGEGMGAVAMLPVIFILPKFADRLHTSDGAGSRCVEKFVDLALRPTSTGNDAAVFR